MNHPIENEIVRRPIQTRTAKWVHPLLQFIYKCGLRPNTVSILSIFFALMAGGCLIGVRYFEHNGLIVPTLLFIGAVIGIQLRLLCNMLDGLLAVECKLRSVTGEIYNDVPDRISDTVIMVCAGYATLLPWSVELGYASAFLAMMTAYIRLLGGSLGLKQKFLGPMAKPHRMFLLTLASLGSIIEMIYCTEFKGYTLYITLIMVCLGSLLTVIRRLMLISKELHHTS